MKNIKNIAAARKVLKEVLKVSEDKKKVSISEAITFPFEILDEFCCPLLLPAMLSGLPIQKFQLKFRSDIPNLVCLYHFSALNVTF